jgi:hypothetical protein
MNNKLLRLRTGLCPTPFFNTNTNLEPLSSLNTDAAFLGPKRLTRFIAI